MKKVRTAICAGITALALSFSGCSNLLSDVSQTRSFSASRSVVVDGSLSIDSSIAIPFGLVADVSQDNLIRLAWGCPSVMPEKWYIYLDGQKVDETSVLKQVEVEAYSGNHVIAVAAVKNGRRSEAEGIEVNVKGNPAPSGNNSGLVSGATYKIIAKCSGKSLDNDNWQTAPGSNVHQWGYGDNQANQQWILRQNSDGSWKIINLYSKLALDAANWGTTDGTNVLQWTDLNNRNQDWFITKEGSYYKIINAYSGLALDVSAASQEDGANVQTWTWNGTDAQLWELTNLSGSNGVEPGNPNPGDPERNEGNISVPESYTRCFR